MARRPAEVARAKSCKTVKSFCQHGSQWSLLDVIDECELVADPLLGSYAHWPTCSRLYSVYTSAMRALQCHVLHLYFLKAIQVYTVIWLNQSQHGLWKHPVNDLSTSAGLLPSMVFIWVVGFHCTVFAMATHPVLWCFETDHLFFLPSSSGINSEIATIGHPCQVKTVTAHLNVLMTGLISAHALPKHFYKSLWSCGKFKPWTNKTRCVLSCKKKKKILNS